VGFARLEWGKKKKGKKKKTFTGTSLTLRERGRILSPRSVEEEEKKGGVKGDPREETYSLSSSCRQQEKKKGGGESAPCEQVSTSAVIPATKKERTDNWRIIFDCGHVRREKRRAERNISALELGKKERKYENITIYQGLVNGDEKKKRGKEKERHRATERTDISCLSSLARGEKRKVQLTPGGGGKKKKAASQWA